MLSATYQSEACDVCLSTHLARHLNGAANSSGVQEIKDAYRVAMAIEGEAPDGLPRS